MNENLELIFKKSHINAKYHSFGEKNPDKIFFVIYRPNLGAGMCSNIRWVLRYLAILENTDLIPILDDINFPCFYSEKEPINNTYSWWNYYFKPLSTYSLDEVYNSKHVLICDGNYVGSSGYYAEDAEITELESKMYEKYFKFNQFFIKDLESDNKYNTMIEFLRTPTLGIQFRGSDMTWETRHLTPMTVPQAIKYADKYLKQENLSQIYLATECEQYKLAFVNYYQQKGIKVLCNNETFGGLVKVANEPNSISKYLAGKDMLLDLIGLTKCKVLLGVKTNVLMIADLMTKNLGNKKFYLNNGRNFKSIILNKFRWTIVNKLYPNHFILKSFGIKDEIIK